MRAIWAIWAILVYLEMENGILMPPLEFLIYNEGLKNKYSLINIHHRMLNFIVLTEVVKHILYSAGLNADVLLRIDHTSTGATTWAHFLHSLFSTILNFTLREHHLLLD